MADFTALKTAIQTYIKQNGNEEITGEKLQEILLSVVTTLGDSAINDLVTALANEVAARQNADGTLQQNITNEATARGNADTALSNRLGSSITAENTAADQIGAEAEARAAADTALQGLIDGITDNIENGYVYAGIATPSSTPATGKVFYLALTAGTYTNFGSTEVSQGINILKYNGSAWSLDAFIGIDDEPTPNSPKLVKSSGAFDSVMTNGSAFDISAHFASGGTLATYADLDAALTALNTLSASYKRGGMSIKYIQSSDNKYVQARCMAQSFTTDVTQWQGVDDEPTAGSDNLVKSGGVFTALKTQEGTLADTASMLKLEIGGINVETGVETSSLNRMRSIGYIQAPFNIVLKSGYNILFVIEYSRNDNGVISYNQQLVYKPSFVADNTKVYRVVIRRDDDANVTDTDLTTCIDDFMGKINYMSEYSAYTNHALQAKDIAEFYKIDNTLINSSGEKATHSAFDTYITPNDCYSKIIIKVASTTNLQYAVAFYNSTSISNSSLIADKSIMMNGSIIELEALVPENCKLIAVCNMRTQFASPIASLCSSYSKVQDANKGIKNEIKLSLNPFKNIFDVENSIEGKYPNVSGSTWSIETEKNSRCVIIPLLGYGSSSYLHVSIPVSRRSQTYIIFLDENLTPVYNGGSYPLAANNANVYYGLGSAAKFGLKYACIGLYRALDYNNTNTSYYVLSDKEKAQGYPDWINDVVVNFTDNNNTSLEVKDKEVVILDSYDFGKVYENGRATAEFCKHVMKHYNGSVVKQFNLLLATDSHTDFNYPSMANVKDMIELSNNTHLQNYVDCIIHNGDIATPAYTFTKQQAIDDYLRYYNVIKESGVDYIQVCGNHDKHQENNVPFADALTNADIVDYFKEYSKHSADTLYQVYDYADKKVRIIKLDTWDFPLENEGGVVKYPLTLLSPYISQSQLEWFIAQLSSTPADYTVIVAGHVYNDSVLTDEFAALMAALRDKTSGTISIDYPEGYPVSNVSANYDFTSSAICYPAIIFTGHVHRDEYKKSNGIHILSTGCQLMDNGVGTLYPGRVESTPNQNLFNMISIDYISHRIYITRYGFCGNPDYISNVESDYKIKGYLEY